MGSIQNRLNNIRGKKKQDFCKTIVSFMTYFHMSWKETMDLPIPAFMEMSRAALEIEKEKVAKSKGM